jgi:RHS repeat-associated protein
LLVVAESGGSVQWLVTDQLGTPRMIADQTGSLAGIRRHDYLPFGEELVAGVGGRSAPQGYVSDNVKQKLTQKERDEETGLDYFGARFYSAGQGRFTGVDPVVLTKKQMVNPQRWNKYAYVINNPVTSYDPNGREDKGKGGGKVIDVKLLVDTSSFSPTLIMI